MSELRIEFTERYIIPPDEDELETAKNLKLDVPKGEIKYRRIYVRLKDVFCPREVPGTTKYCEIEFQEGYTLLVKGSYDEICQQIDDRSSLLDEE